VPKFAQRSRVLKAAAKRYTYSVGRACNPVKSKPEIWDSQAKDFVANLQRVFWGREAALETAALLNSK
jgi:hypothetical protein